MSQETVIIPEKIYFKIGEVCELVGVQAHVLRYWESEFSILSPQKNKSGQRSYRRRDVEIALRIKRLLYNEMFTIAGARKKIQSEARGEGAAAKSAGSSGRSRRLGTDQIAAPTLFDTGFEDRESGSRSTFSSKVSTSESAGVQALRTVRMHLLELRDLLRAGSEVDSRQNRD
ncbi:MAG: MerR family transcriptional regulator [Pyrinomonadaceae bacterium]